MGLIIFVLHYIIRVFILALIVRAVISWVAPTSRHPAIVALIRITDPPLEPIRNIIGVRGGVDISPLVVIFILYLIDNLLIGLLR